MERYREVFEMLKEEIMVWFSVGQEGQEKPGSVSGIVSLENFLSFPTLNTPKGTKGMNFQEFRNFMIRKSVQNFLPFVPLRVGWGIQGRKDRNFPIWGGIGKVTIVNTPNTPLVPGGI